jgi:hypothetical protein
MKKENIMRAGQVVTVPGTDKVLFTVFNKYGYAKIFSVSVEGGPLEPFTRKSASAPNVSPDGKWLLCNPDSGIEHEFRSSGRMKNLLTAHEDGPLRVSSMQSALERNGSAYDWWYNRDSYDRFMYRWPTNFGYRIALQEISPGGKEMLVDTITEKGKIYADFSLVSWAPGGRHAVLEAAVPPADEDDSYYYYSRPTTLVILRTGETASLRTIPGKAVKRRDREILCWTRDGSRFYYRIRDSGWYSGTPLNGIMAYDVDRNEAFSLYEFSDGEWFWKFSPESGLLYFYRRGPFKNQEEKSHSEKTMTETVIQRNIHTGGEQVLYERSDRSSDSRFVDLYSPTITLTKSSELFVRYYGRETPMELTHVDPESGITRSVDQAPFLAIVRFLPDENRVLYFFSEEQTPKTRNVGLRITDLSTGEIHNIAKDGVNITERTALSGNDVVVFVKGYKEIWSAGADGTWTKRLYPPETPE